MRLLQHADMVRINGAQVPYRHAVEQRYRFYSYGDCMLIV